MDPNYWFRDLPEDVLEPEQNTPIHPNQPKIKRSPDADHPEDCPTKRRHENAVIPIENEAGKKGMGAETPRAMPNENQNVEQQHPTNGGQEMTDFNPLSVGQLEDYFAYSPPHEPSDSQQPGVVQPTHHMLYQQNYSPNEPMHLREHGYASDPIRQPMNSSEFNNSQHSQHVEVQPPQQPNHMHQFQATPHHSAQLQLHSQNFAPQMHQMQPNPSHQYAQLHPLNAPPRQSEGYRASMAQRMPHQEDRNPYQQVFRVEPAQHNSYSTPSNTMYPNQSMQRDGWTMQQRGNYQPLVPFNYGVPYIPACAYNGMNSGVQHQGALQTTSNSYSLPSTTPKYKPRQTRRAKPNADPKQFNRGVPSSHANSPITNSSASNQLIPLTDNFSVRTGEYGTTAPTQLAKIPSNNGSSFTQDIGDSSDSKATAKNDGSLPIVFSNANSWIGKKRTVVVKVEEIERRMGAPEFQTIRMIQRLTRHARTSFNAFEQKLVDAGIPINKELNSEPACSTIEMLLEADALTLALDFNKLSFSELCKSTLASIATCGEDRNVQAIGEHAQHISEFLMCVKKHLLRIGREPGNIVEKQLYDPNCPDSRAVHKFSHETHGFGPRAVITVIDKLNTVVELIKKEEGRQMVKQANIELFKQISDGTNGTEIEKSVTMIQSDDSDVYDEAVLPRIGYDVELIKVTRGEVRRRIQGPEKFTPTLLCAFLRKEKIAGSLPNLRVDLHNIGIPFDEKRKTKKSIQATSWTSISEKESMDLARETGAFLMQMPPSKEMREKASGHPQAAAWISFMAASIEKAMNKIGETPGDRQVETMADEHLFRFALITHHFGHNFYASVMAWLQKVLR